MTRIASFLMCEERSSFRRLGQSFAIIDADPTCGERVAGRAGCLRVPMPSTTVSMRRLATASMGSSSSSIPWCPKMHRRDSPTNSSRYGAWKRRRVRAIWPLGLTGTVRYMVFFAIVVKTRAVEIAGIATNPDGKWMQQMARNLTDSVDGFLRNATYLIHDRDPLFTEAFEAILAERGVKCVRIPARSPNCNPHAERFVKTVRDECLNHLVLFGERHLRYVIKEFMAHYHRERFHQGLGGQLIEPRPARRTKRWLVARSSAGLGWAGC
jgi:hypothetical protein